MNPFKRGGTPPGKPPKQRRQKRKTRRRSSSSSSTSSDEAPPRRKRKSRESVTAKDVLKLLLSWKGESNKNMDQDTRLNNNTFNNVIPEFDPTKGSQTIECWLRKVNECSSIYGWNDKQTIHFSLQKLVGLAKKWFEALPTVVFTWEEWQLKLKRAFPSCQSYGRLLEEMLSRTSRSDEHLRDYFYEKLTLLTRCEIVGRKAVECIVYGITDRTIRSGAQALNCSEPEDLLNFLCSQKPQQPFINSSKTRDRVYKLNTLDNAGSYSNSSNSSVLCYNCHKRGHPFFKCPKPLVRCKICKRVGHDIDSCKLEPLRLSNSNTNRTDDPPEKKTLKIDTTCKSNDKFYKTATVNELPLEAYIDFGSECTLLRKKEAELLGLEKGFDAVPVVKGFGESSVIPLYRAFAHVKVDEVDSKVEVLVIDNEFMQNALIIGQNFTELSFITVLKDSQRLTFYRSPNHIDGCDEKLKLFVAESIEVSDTAVVPVCVESGFTGDILIDGYTATEPGKEYSVLQGAYHLTDGKGEVIISNLTPRALIFKENQLIARSIPFEERTITHVNKIVQDITQLEPLNKDDIKVGPGIDGAQLDRLYTLLQNYRDCFAMNLGEVGCAVDMEMKIELLDHKPIVYRPYRLSHTEREKVRETIEELLHHDIIQESNSDYASPILMVKKKTGEQRLCVDFRALNNKTIKDRFPLPVIDDQISNLSGNSLFTTLDLASGYYQVPMAVESRHLTGFVTPDGHFEFKRMPFGLANAPAVFQRMINKILGNRRFEYALAYLDDVLVPSKNVEEMFQRLEDILKLFKQNCLSLKLSKCRFFDTSVNYLGYEISSEGVKPGEAKIMAVKEFPKPSNIHEVRQFLGLTGYFRKFVKGYGELAQTLTSLLRKDAVWEWSDRQDASFIQLKEKLVSRPVLALYDPTLETEVHTDASSLGIGGMLMQWQRETRELKPVAYFSRQTTPEEKHLHSYELETLAVVGTLKKFRVYLLGLHFKVFTDCAALRTTLTKRDLIPRIARWWLQICEFDFEIEYRAGLNMRHVDALSRNTTLTVESDENQAVNIYNIEKENWLLTLQIADPDISRILKVLKPQDDQECKDIRKNYIMKNHTLYRKVDDGHRLVVPRSARWQICRANHDDIGHHGYTKTLEKIQSLYWFPKLRKFVKKYVSACIECAYNKDSASKQKSGYLYPIEKVNIPFHTVHMDHLGPFVRSKNGNTYILTVVEAFTKYVFVKAVKDLKTKTTTKELQKIFYDFGIPARIISDRGTSFTSKAFKSFCNGHGIKHILNAVACPRANGQAERYNQTILNSLASQNSLGHERDWDKCLGKVQWGINNTIHSSTQKTATEALFGVRMQDDLTNKLDMVDNSRGQNLQEIRQNIDQNIKRKQATMKAKHDQNRVPAVTYNVGDLVKIRRNNFDNGGKSTKLLSKFIGPYKITDVLGNDRYKIANVPGFNKNYKPYATTIASDRMRPWIHVKALEVHNTDSSSELSSDDN